MGKKIKENAYEIIVMLVCTAVFCFFVSCKQGYHMDELLSFELANAEFNPWIVPTQPEGRLAKFVHNEIDGGTFGETVDNLAETVKDVLQNRGNSRLLTYTADVYEEPVWITSEQFKDYITVGPGDAFNYLSVYFNVKDDNHPPLHFMLLHTVSSLFQGRISPWMGCVINIAAVLWVMVLLYRICRIMAPGLGMEKEGRRLGLMTALFYGLSTGALVTVLLIRMYGMLTLWCVLYFYLILGKWQDASFDRKNGKLILVTMLGFWTQYYFLFYCLLLAAVVSVCLGKDGRWKELFCFVRSMVIAAAVGLLAFPFAIGDVFSSGRGVEALGNLSRGLSGYGTRLIAFGRILLNRGIGYYSLCLFLLLAAVLWAGKKGRTKGATLLKGGDGAEQAGSAGKASQTGNAEKIEPAERKTKESIDRAENSERATGRNEDRTERETERNADRAEQPEREAGRNADRAEQPEREAGRNADRAEQPEREAGRNVKNAGRREQNEFWWMLLLPVAGYFLLAARMSPYLVDRYIMPLFPFIVLTLMLAVFGFLGKIYEIYPEKRTKKLTITVCRILVILQVWNLWCYDGSYLYIGYGLQRMCTGAYAKSPCICVYDGVGYYENLLEFTQYDRTLLLTLEELENRVDRDSIAELDQVAVIVKGGVDELKVLNILSEAYGFKIGEVMMRAPGVYGDEIFIMRKGVGQ